VSELPPHLRPFVLPHDPVEPHPVDDLHLYLPDGIAEGGSRPAVLMVHGGPVPPERAERPPDWPAYRAYGALLARAGLVGVMIEHGFVSDETLPRARDDVRAAIEALRADPAVDPTRVGLWFFSAGGLLLGSFLDPPPDGVAAVAGTYAYVGDEDLPSLGLADGVQVAARSSLPLLLVRPEHDVDEIAAVTDDLLARCAKASRPVDVLEVSGAHHGFETVDDTDAARAAIRDSVAWWVARLLPA
jgi:dienelactone hydrolase